MEVSVIIPVYNREKTIRRCLMSVLTQTLKPLEIILIDDGSTDKTIKIAEEISSSIIIIKQNHKGAQAARNLGILNAKGEYIAFLDSDDEWLPELLEKETILLSQCEGSCVVYSDCYVCYGNRRSLWRLPECTKNSYSTLLIHPGPMFQSMIVKKELFLKIGLLDESVVAYQEWDTAIQLARIANFVHYRIPLFNYHIHGEKTISKNKQWGIDGYRYIVKKYRYEILKEQGVSGLKEHYKNLIRQCVECKNIQIFVFIVYILCIYFFEILEKLIKSIKNIMKLYIDRREKGFE